jgi:hypothetical protein
MVMFQLRLLHLSKWAEEEFQQLCERILTDAIGLESTSFLISGTPRTSSSRVHTSSKQFYEVLYVGLRVDT